MSKRLKLVSLTAGIGIGLWAIDKYIYSSTFERNLNTIFTAALITVDYKLNFVSGDDSAIEQLHSRVAKRISDVCRRNQGLYIKFGQQVAGVPVLPPQYLSIFKEFYDNAPAIPYEQVEQLFQQEFNSKISDHFTLFSTKPMASASIAQVHKATLKDGTIVAVKIQKPQISIQMGWDLFTYRAVIYCMEKLFDLPLYWSADYIEKHVRLETDFINEAMNSEKCYKSIQQVPELRNNVHVPKVYWDYTTKKIMTCEWIEGIRFSDTEKLKSSGFSLKDIMTSMVLLFSDQIFRVGFVHCDPHPGNFIIRQNPNSIFKVPELVILDHGLYVQCTPQFKHDYAVFWKSLFIMDYPTINRIGENWGINDVQLFASATLQKTWLPGKAVHIDKNFHVSDVFDRQVQAKAKLRNFLKNTELLPKELIFIGRNMNCVRSNNKVLGSPVNRINIMADYAIKTLGNDWTVWNRSSSDNQSKVWGSSAVSFFQARINYFIFKGMLWVTSIGFYASRFYQVLVGVFGYKTGGFEAITDLAVKNAIQEEFGIKVDDSVFDG